MERRSTTLHPIHPLGKVCVFSSRQGTRSGRKFITRSKVVEFLAIAVDASCTHMYAPGTRRHIRKALELGATKEEVTAVLQAVSVLGIHTCSLGAPILLEELEAIEQQRTVNKRSTA
jgi:alkylhydroperoxidase/carboxymuconolactone decarboxylase family protein YurZ